MFNGHIAQLKAVWNDPETVPSTLSTAAAGYATLRDSPTRTTMSTFYDIMLIITL